MTTRTIFLRDENDDTAEVVKIGLSQGGWTYIERRIVHRDKNGNITHVEDQPAERVADETVAAMTKFAEAQSIEFSERSMAATAASAEQDDARIRHLKRETDILVDELDKQAIRIKELETNAATIDRVQQLERSGGLSLEDARKWSDLTFAHELLLSQHNAKMRELERAEREADPGTWVPHGSYESLNLAERTLLHERARRRGPSPGAMSVSKLPNGKYGTRARSGR